MSVVRLKAKPQLAYKGRMERHDDAAWLIWSNKRGCWYRPGSAGYTSDIAQAGIYTKDEAFQHYDGPETPREYRDTEPFPISSVRRHVALARRALEAEYAKRSYWLSGLESALSAPAEIDKAVEEGGDG